MAEQNPKFEIKAACMTVIITLWDKSFGTFNEAIGAIAKEYPDYADKKIFYMSSIERENEPLKILVVFEF